MDNADPEPFDVALSAPTGWSFMALLGGRLVVHQGWLHLGGDGEHPLLVVFPDGQVEVGERDLVYQGRRLQIGQDVQLGGGLDTVRCDRLLRGPDWPGEVRVARIGG